MFLPYKRSGGKKIDEKKIVYRFMRDLFVFAW